jgi:anti-sigma regulatory factor (Ser/Thr protein kinase)
MQEIDLREVLDSVNTAAQPGAMPTLRVRLRALPSSVSALRADVRSWLTDLDARADEILDLQLACSEVLTMVIEQAETPVALILDAEGVIDGDTVTIRIREYGLCRSTAAHALDDQVLGFALIQALVDVCEVHARVDGRTITLKRRIRSGTREELRPPFVADQVSPTDGYPWSSCSTTVRAAPVLRTIK